MTREQLLERIRIEDRGYETPCWIYTGWLDPLGYGRARVGYYAPAQFVHRIVYELRVGPIPEGLELDHLCRVSSCCNPRHLEPVTHAENVRRGEATQPRCKLGHLLEGDNIKLDYRGWRRCRECSRIWQREYMRKQRAAANVV